MTLFPIFVPACGGKKTKLFLLKGKVGRVHVSVTGKTHKEALKRGFEELMRGW